LRGVSEEVILYQCLPPELAGRTFQGALRRRESNGETLSDEEMAVRSIHTNDADLSTDVASLAWEDLQKLAKSLQDQLTASKVQEFCRSSSASKNSLGINNRRRYTARLVCQTIIPWLETDLKKMKSMRLLSMRKAMPMMVFPLGTS
jgi:hypothetical protein